MAEQQADESEIPTLPVIEVKVGGDGPFADRYDRRPLADLMDRPIRAYLESVTGGTRTHIYEGTLGDLVRTIPTSAPNHAPGHWLVDVENAGEWLRLEGRLRLARSSELGLVVKHVFEGGAEDIGDLYDRAIRLVHSPATAAWELVAKLSELRAIANPAAARHLSIAITELESAALRIEIAKRTA